MWKREGKESETFCSLPESFYGLIFFLPALTLSLLKNYKEDVERMYSLPDAHTWEVPAFTFNRYSNGGGEVAYDLGFF